MSDPAAQPPWRCLFLGYLWRVAEVLARHPRTELIAAGIEPQRPRTASMKQACERLGISTWDARGIRTSKKLRAWLDEGVDLVVVGAFGQILPRWILDAPRFGVLNVHGSWLPEYRGGCPLEEQILDGCKQAGASLHWMSEEVDAGPIVARRRFAIGDHDTYEQVYQRFHRTAADLLEQRLAESPESWPQVEQPAAAPARPPLDPAAGRICWSQPAEGLERRVRALGWRQWVRAPVAAGDEVILHEARAETLSEPATPGMVLEAGEHPLVTAGDRSALRLTRWEGGPLPLGTCLAAPLAAAPRPRVAMMQPTFLPWQGYFALMAQADLFVFLDDFQFSRRSYHQRNRLLKGGGRWGWLTLPVEHTGAGRPALDQVRATPDAATRRKMLESIRHAYATAPFFDSLFGWIEKWIEEPWPHLAAMNEAMIVHCARLLGIETPVAHSSELEGGGKRSARIAALLEATGARTYLAARGSAAYMLEDGVFPLEGVTTLFQDFEPRPYPQRGVTAFVPYLSVLDALFQLGPDATRRLIVRGQGAFVEWSTLAADADQGGGDR